MRMPAEFVIPREFDGARLDAALVLALPESGLRARRRLWEGGLVLANGTPRKPGWIVRAGDIVRVQPEAEQPEQARDATAARGHIIETPPFGIIGLGNGFVAFDKPAGLHTAHIEGSPSSSLERLLPGFWEGLWGAFHASSGGKALPLSATPPPQPRLVTRLDADTSGIVLGLIPGLVPMEPGPVPASHGQKNGNAATVPARHSGGAPTAEDAEAELSIFRKWERQGKARKEYFALVCGEAGGILDLRQPLDTANRRITKVLAGEERDRTRHTHVEPLAVVRPEVLREKGMLLTAPPAAVFTLVRVTILRGARHQIRAHLAHAGFPILGDEVYGEALVNEKELTALKALRMYLHHARLCLPDFSVQSLPGWNIGEYPQLL